MFMNSITKHFLKFGAMAFSVIFALPKNNLVDLAAQLLEHSEINIFLDL